MPWIVIIQQPSLRQPTMTYLSHLIQSTSKSLGWGGGGVLHQ